MGGATPFYFVPGVLGHFDTEAIHALIAPRPHLELSGDQDGGAPTDGIEVLEKKGEKVDYAAALQEAKHRVRQQPKWQSPYY